MNSTSISKYLAQINQPSKYSHKGENGKVLVIGGSDLFHAASQWSFEVASRLVDMVFYSSVSDNNQIIKQTKGLLHDGVVIPRSQLPNYAEEVDTILIGPGMRRDVPSRFSSEQLNHLQPADLKAEDWENDTLAVVSVLLRHFPHKQWVIDAGALQIIHPGWLPERAILTPHAKEFSNLVSKISSVGIGTDGQIASQLPLKLRDDIEIFTNNVMDKFWQDEESIPPRIIESDEWLDFSNKQIEPQNLFDMSASLNNAYLILKGAVDIIFYSDRAVAVVGGNPGLTKGGSGDVLAGLVAGLVATSDIFSSLVVSSFLNKKAGHDLWLKQGNMFNTSDLVRQIPVSFKLLKQAA